MAYVAGEVTRLIGDLAADDELRLETAVARLTILGTRAVAPLIAALTTPSLTAVKGRLAALRVLEAIGDRRVAGAMLPLLADRAEPVVTMTLSILAGELRDPNGSPSVLETVVDLALDAARGAVSRQAALDVLRTLPPRTLRALRVKLSTSSDPLISLWLEDPEAESRSPVSDGRVDLIARAAEGTLPDSPEHLRRAITVSSKGLSLVTLQRAIDTIRAQEAQESNLATRIEWQAARAAAHQALAGRGSKVAVYDLRESFEQATAPLPVGFLAAIGAIGDETCLEGIARAYAHSVPSDDWWRRHLAQACTEIVTRRRLTRRHRVLKRIAARWPEALEALLPRK